MTISEIDFGESFIGILTEVQWEELLVKTEAAQTTEPT